MFKLSTEGSHLHLANLKHHTAKATGRKEGGDLTLIRLIFKKKSINLYCILYSNVLVCLAYTA